MAKAKKITGFDSDMDVLDWADKVLRVRFGEILEKRDAALEPDSVAGVHDMRVAIRRLRSALRDFSTLLKRKPLKQFRKDLKRFARALGEVRDEDVTIIALKNLRKKARDRNVREGIGELVAQRKEKRERAHLGILEILSATSIKNLQKSYDEAIGEMVQGKNSAQNIGLKQAARKIVSRSLEEFCDLSANIYEPFVDEPLHKFRIAAKRLRYGIELYADCWGERIKPFVEEIKDMQDFLGEVHDADVWLENLSKILTEERDENPANLWLLSEFVNQRTRNYRAALKLWSDWKENDFLERLEKTVSQTK